MESPIEPKSAAPAVRYRRRRKLIRPRLQLKLTGIATGVALVALLLQFLLFSRVTATLAARMPNDALYLLELAQRELLWALVTSVCLLLPLSIGVGILSTFRVAGPVYRLERYLQQVADGERPADCRLRDGDELQDLCRLVNEATRPLRVEGDRDREAA